MKLLLRQRPLSFLGRYDVYDDRGEVVFLVQGQFAMVPSFLLCDASGEELGKIRRKAWSFLPSFRCETEAGEFSVSRSSAFFPSYKISPLGYVAKGDFPAWNYSILDGNGDLLAKMSKKIFRLSDAYEIDVLKEGQELLSLCLALCVDDDLYRR